MVSSCRQTGLLRTRVSKVAHDHAKEEEGVNLGNPWSSNLSGPKETPRYWASTGAVSEGKEEAIYA